MARPDLNGHGAALRAVPKGYKPPRDRPVRNRTVPCPDCPAQVDEPCVNIETGQPFTSAHFHRARRRMALRAETREP